MNNRRERILLVVIAGLLVLYGVRFLTGRMVLEPLRRQRLQSEHLRREIGLKRKQLETLQHGRARLAEWRRVSLPPQEALAQSQYEDYLFDLVQQYQVRNWVVEPGTVLDDEHMTRFPFRITGQITLDNLTGLLHAFYQPRLLHRIRRLDLQRLRDSDRDVRMILSVEGISVHGARRSELLPGDLARGGPLDGTQPDQFAVIAERDILAPQLLPSRRPMAEPQPPLTADADAASFVHLTGTPVWGADRQAWLHDRRTNAHWILRDGQPFDIAGLHGRLLAIHESHVELQIDGQRGRWR